jgi:hypothetical protein
MCLLHGRHIILNLYFCKLGHMYWAAVGEIHCVLILNMWPDAMIFLIFLNWRSWCSGMLFLRYCGLCLVLRIAVTTNRSGHTLLVCMQPMDTWHLYGNISRYQGVQIRVLCSSTVNGLRKTLVTTVEVKWMFCTNTSVFCTDNILNIYIN